MSKAKPKKMRVNKNVFKHMRKIKASFGNRNKDGEHTHKWWPVTVLEPMQVQEWTTLNSRSTSKLTSLSCSLMQQTGLDVV